MYRIIYERVLKPLITSQFKASLHMIPKVLYTLGVIIPLKVGISFDNV